MRCACFLACCAKWVAAGQRGVCGGRGGPHSFEKGNTLLCVKCVCWANEGKLGRSTQDALLNDTKTEGDNDTSDRVLNHSTSPILPPDPKVKKKYMQYKDKVIFKLRIIKNKWLFPPLMYKSDNSVTSLESGSDTRQRVPLVFAIMTDDLQGTPRSLAVKTHLNKCELLENYQML